MTRFAFSIASVTLVLTLALSLTVACEADDSDPPPEDNELCANKYGVCKVECAMQEAACVQTVGKNQANCPDSPDPQFCWQYNEDKEEQCHEDADDCRDGCQTMYDMCG